MVGWFFAWFDLFAALRNFEITNLPFLEFVKKRSSPLGCLIPLNDCRKSLPVFLLTLCKPAVSQSVQNNLEEEIRNVAALRWNLHKLICFPFYISFSP